MHSERICGVTDSTIPASKTVPRAGCPNPPISPWRINLLRLAYLIMVSGLGTFIVPALFTWTDAFVVENGVRTALLAGFAAMALLGLRYPLKMIPLILLEFTWKVIYLACYYVPLWFAGRVTGDIWEDGGAAMMGLIFVPLVPWDYIYREYIKKSGDRWW
jgi:hypothetical protein